MKTFDDATQANIQALMKEYEEACNGDFIDAKRERILLDRLNAILTAHYREHLAKHATL